MKKLVLYLNHACDGAGRLAPVTYWGNDIPAIAYSYAPRGRLTQVVDAAGTRTITYNADNTSATETVPNVAGHTVTHIYDTLGRETALKLMNGATALYNAGYTYSNKSCSATNPWKFSSEYHDGETNWVYYNYRYYAPQLGRWISRDPIGELGGVNLFCYGSNNFVRIDYLGLSDCKKLGVNTFSWRASIKKDPISFSFGLKGKWSYESCKKCCSNSKLVVDEKHTLNLNFFCSATAATNRIQFEDDGWQIETWYGIRLTGTLSGDAGGEFSTDKCNGRGLTGKVCGSGNATFSAAGGGGVRLSRKGFLLNAGVNITGEIFVKVTTCYICQNGICEWSTPQYDWGGAISLNINAVFWDVNYKIWDF